MRHDDKQIPIPRSATIEPPYDPIVELRRATLRLASALAVRRRLNRQLRTAEELVKKHRRAVKLAQVAAQVAVQHAGRAAALPGADVWSGAGVALGGVEAIQEAEAALATGRCGACGCEVATGLELCDACRMLRSLQLAAPTGLHIVRTADGTIRMHGGPYGEHTITSDSSPERIRNHWLGYIGSSEGVR
ncbi:MAG: hypothetical protein ABII76_17205 [Pseudomonadota bacterium]